MIKIIAILIFFILALGLLSTISFGTSEKAITVQGLERKYFLHLPKDYNSSKKYPLVIMLHGYSDHPRLMEFYTGMSKKADKEGFIVVYPKGTNDSRDNKLSWNADFCCGGAKREKVDEIAFINTLIDELKKNHSVDSKKIFVAGISNGGMLAHKFGSMYPSKVMAIAAISSAIGGESILISKPEKPLSILMMNGSKDIVLPFEGGDGRDGMYTSAKESVNFWSVANKCSKNKIDETSIYKKTVFSECTSKKEVVFYEIKNGNHVWFGGKQDILNIIKGKSVSANDEIWNFFKQQYQ